MKHSLLAFAIVASFALSSCNTSPKKDHKHDNKSEEAHKHDSDSEHKHKPSCSQEEYKVDANKATTETKHEEAPKHEENNHDAHEGHEGHNH